MTETPLPFFWLSHPGAEAPPKPWRPLSDAAYWESPSRAPDRRQLLAPAPDWADDLQRVARAVFAADRHALRTDGFDRWTRHIRLSVPVAAPDHWARALPHLTVLLETVTGDRWEVEFRPFATPPPRAFPLTFAPSDLAREVALFSGGLDSLGWAAQRATVRTPAALLLVTFEERNFEAVQEGAFRAVSRRSGRPLRRLVQSQTVRGLPGSGTALERSTRSRGLLYATAAVHAAAAEGVPVVRIPENGQLALNPPLSPGRAGACSTRSVHPWTLHHLNRVIAEVDGSARAGATGTAPGTVRVENPFADLTKGEVCAVARDTGMPRAVLESALSCGNPPSRHPRGSSLGHCGLCFPCLVRRAGLLHAFGEDRTPYETDPWEAGLPQGPAGHWQALRRWLETPCTALDLVADTPLPPGARPEELIRVVERGRDELRALVDSTTHGRRAA